MPSDAPSDDLISRLLAAMGQQDGVASIITAAHAQAEQEVRGLLVSAFKANLLRQAVAQIEGPCAAPSNESSAAEPSARTNVATGCYLYAITSALWDATLPAGPGVDPEYAIEAIVADDLQAIVSDVALAEFGPNALDDHVTDPRWIEEKVRAHDRILKSALSIGVVIPCRFCTILRSRDVVRQLLVHHHDRIASLLSSLAGKSEWGVKVFYSASSAAASEPHHDLSGKAYLQQKRHEQDRQRRLQRAARERADSIHEQLATIACDATLLPIRKAAGNDKTQSPLVNGAYLVADADVPRFQGMLDSLADQHAGDGWSVELTGPWPPYNFAHLDLSMEKTA